MSQERREHVFLVRMWVESATSQQGAWRGVVSEIASGRKLYVTDPGEVAEFMTRHLLPREDRDVQE